MGKFLKELAEHFAHEAASDDQVELAPFPRESALQNPKVKSILDLLARNQLLVEPTLRFVQQKEAELAEAQLIVLYGREEYERMRQREIERIASA